MSLGKPFDSVGSREAVITPDDLGEILAEIAAQAHSLTALQAAVAELQEQVVALQARVLPEEVGGKRK